MVISSEFCNKKIDKSHQTNENLNHNFDQSGCIVLQK